MTMKPRPTESRAPKAKPPSPPPVFFVSSVVEDFREYREAARRGIEAAGGKALLINEDRPSLSTSSRNACLDGVESSDHVLSIVGQRGGWRAPSGLLVVDEEFEHARKHNIPILAFLQKVARDSDAEQFARKISDYVGGVFRTTFETPEELEALVEHAVREKIAMGSKNAEAPDLSPFLNPRERESSDESLLRLAFAPEREGEVFDPVRLASPEFEREVYEIGHANNVGLFDFRSAKSAEVGDGDLVIVQDHAGRRREQHEYVRLAIMETGWLVIDANVTGRVMRGTPASMLDAFTVAIEDIEGVLRTGLRFAGALYDATDRHRRHELFFYNVALRQLGHRKLVRSPRVQSSYGWNGGGDDPVLAFSQSRSISRSALCDPKDEVARVIATFERLTRDR
jgi:hypothetical protein